MIRLWITLAPSVLSFAVSCGPVRSGLPARPFVVVVEERSWTLLFYFLFCCFLAVRYCSMLLLYTAVMIKHVPSSLTTNHVIFLDRFPVSIKSLSIFSL